MINVVNFNVLFHLEITMIIKIINVKAFALLLILKYY